MFTGLVETRARVRAVERRGAGLRLVLDPPEPDWRCAGGESISVSGACLTVLPAEGGDGPSPLAFDVSAETLARTWFQELAPGQAVNLERSLQLGARLDGHLVSGHVDGTGTVQALADTQDGGRRMTVEVPEELARFLVEKGSITVDGVSLTVVEPRGRRFDVALVPHTLERTTLGAARAGARVNLEADLLGKWIDRLLVARGG
jgi:riboflavin synthase